MSQKRLKISKTEKSEFETYEKSLDPTTDCYFPNMKPLVSLIWEHFSLSLLASSPTQSRNPSKISQKLSHLREKTINPELQLACFSLVHIKVQRNGTFHPKNVRLKDDFKRHICDCEFTIVAHTRTES